MQQHDRTSFEHKLLLSRPRWLQRNLNPFGSWFGLFWIDDSTTISRPSEKKQLKSQLCMFLVFSHIFTAGALAKCFRLQLAALTGFFAKKHKLKHVKKPNSTLGGQGSVLFQLFCSGLG